MKPVQKQCSATIYTHVRPDKKEENEGENRLISGAETFFEIVVHE
jgi:hypothetical protein